jgi:hypothetical protein
MQMKTLYSRMAADDSIPEAKLASAGRLSSWLAALLALHWPSRGVRAATGAT